MVLEALQVLGYSLGVLAWAGAIGTCASPEWRKNSQSQPIIVGTSLRCIDIFWFYVINVGVCFVLPKRGKKIIH